MVRGQGNYPVREAQDRPSTLTDLLCKLRFRLLLCGDDWLRGRNMMQTALSKPIYH